MTYRGHVKNGQILLDEAVELAEGAQVNVEVVQNDTKREVETATEQETIWDKLLKLSGTVEGLEPDSAENHDHYLYGVPKKR